MTKPKNGFKANPENINRAGRPVGSKSKNTFKDAIKRFQANTLEAAQLIIDIMNGDCDKLGVKEIKISERLNAAKYVIKAPDEMSKPVKDRSPASSDKDDDEDENVVVPLVQIRQS